MATLFLNSCNPGSESRWPVLEADAQRKLRDGFFDDSLREADQGSRESARDTVWNWKFRILKAEALLRKNTPDQAITLLQGELPTDVPLETMVRKRIVQGETLCYLNRAGEAEAVWNQAERIIPSAESTLQAELAFERGMCALTAKPLAAQAYLADAVELARGHDGFIMASALIGDGYRLLQNHHYEHATAKFREALNATDSPLLKEKASGNLGFSYSQLGEWKRAAYFSQQAVSIAQHLGNRGDEEYWLIDLGREHFTQLEYTEAEDSYGKALRIATDLRDGEGMAICLHDLSQLGLRTRDLKKAEDHIRREENTNPKGARYLELLLDEAELAKAQEHFAAAEQLLRQIPDEQSVAPVTRWTTQSDLAAVYVGQGKFDQAEKMFRRAVSTAEAARSQFEGVEYKISFLDSAPFYDDYVRFLVSRNRPVEALGVTELGRSPTLSEGSGKSPRGPSLARIQDVLRRERRVVLAYWLGWKESYLWVITPTQVKLFHLPPEPEVEKEVEAYDREIVVERKREVSKRGEKLYEILLQPAEPLIPKGASVIIVPHRKLYNFNFETLVVPGLKPHYWIEDVASHNVSFLSALTSSRPRAGSTGKKMLLIGAPVLADSRFPVLKHAAEEMEKVAGHFPDAQETSIAGRSATPQAYLATKPGQFGFIHFVTHGRASTVLENPLDAAIILSPDQGSSASSSDPESLYHLYGRDIMKTPLQADLVTVSACYGLGREYSGEGLVGLAWAFMRAGAHQVVAALWEVDDASTPLLMDDFYGELTSGKSASEALRDAKLKMLHSGSFYRHPYYWASLQLYTGW